MLQKWKKLGAAVSGESKIWTKIDLLKVCSVVSLVDGSINVLVSEELENQWEIVCVEEELGQILEF